MLDNRARDFLSQQKGWRWDSARFPLKKIYYFKNINKNSGLRKKYNKILPFIPYFTFTLNFVFQKDKFTFILNPSFHFLH